MATLTETTKSVRKYLIYFLVFAFTVILFQQIYKLINPSDDPTDIKSSSYAFVDNKFGEIQYPEIPSLALTNDAAPTFSTSSTFDSSPTSVNIYQREEPRETLGSTDYGLSIAKKLGITSTYTTEGSVFTWKTKDKKTLEYDKITRSITYNNLGIDLAKIRKEKPAFVDIENIETALQLALKPLLSSSGTTVNTVRMYLTYDGSEYSKTNVAEAADFVRQDNFLSKEIVSLKEDTKDDRPVTGKIYFDNPDEGHEFIIITNRDYPDRSRDFDMQYIKEFQSKDIEISNTKGVYKLKTVETAWDEVANGKGSLRKLVPQGQTKSGAYTPLNVVRFTAKVELTELGFYATYEHSPYIYPIYIFKGTAQLRDGRTADFIFYIPAIAE